MVEAVGNLSAADALGGRQVAVLVTGSLISFASYRVRLR